MSNKTYQNYRKPSQKADQWNIINQYKAIEEKKAKLYQKYLEQSKKKTLSEQLERQIRERQIRQQAQKQADKYYKSIIIKNTNQAKQQQEKKKRQFVQTIKKNQQENKEQFRGILQQTSITNNNLQKLATSINVGEYENQIKHKKDRQKLLMMDQLDRQIHEKQRQKHFTKKQELQIDQKNYQFLEIRSDKRDKQLHRITYGQNPYVFQKYKQIYEQKLQKQKHFQINQIQEASKRKYEDQMQKIHEKNMNLKYQTENMKRILEEQIKLKNKQKREENAVNPQEHTYGTIGRMLMEVKKPSNKQAYFQQLQKQIIQKQRRLQDQKYMSQEEYRINLNHLNRAFEGKFANNRYIDRSIQSLSDSHKVNVALIDAQIDPTPQGQAIKRKIQELKLRKGQRNSISFSDNKVNNF